MKIAPRQIPSFIQSPDKRLSVILVYGPNTGLVKDYTAKLGKHFVDDINDPFNVASFTASSISEDPARFRDEAAAQSLMGGHRLILIKDVAESITTYVKEIAEAAPQDCVIIIEAGDLKPSSGLRKLCETHQNAAALPCYLEEERNIGGKIRDLCQHAGYAIDPDALRLLSEALAGDSALLRSEVEKLLLYKGFDPSYDGLEGEPLRRKIGDISLDDILACNPNMRDYSLDDVISMAAIGQEQKAHALAQKMLAEGLPPIAIFRAFLRHFRRLQLTVLRVQEGEGLQSAMNALKPKVFFKYEQDFIRQCNKWTATSLHHVIHKIVEDEAASKAGRHDAQLLCLHLVLNIARTANALR